MVDIVDNYEEILRRMDLTDNYLQKYNVKKSIQNFLKLIPEIYNDSNPEYYIISQTQTERLKSMVSQ